MAHEVTVGNPAPFEESTRTVTPSLEDGGIMVAKTSEWSECQPRRRRQYGSGSGMHAHGQECPEILHGEMPDPAAFNI